VRVLTSFNEKNEKRFRKFVRKLKRAKKALVKLDKADPLPNGEERKLPPSFILLDDFVGDINMDSQLMKGVISHSRHWNTSVFILVQDAVGSLTTFVRKNTRFAVMFYAIDEGFRKALHKSFGGRCANFTQFDAILREATSEQYGALLYRRDAPDGGPHYFRFKAPAVLPSGRLPMPESSTGDDADEDTDGDNEDNDDDDDDGEMEARYVGLHLPSVPSRPLGESVREPVVSHHEVAEPVLLEEYLDRRGEVKSRECRSGVIIEHVEPEADWLHDRALSDDEEQEEARSRRSRSHDREVVPIRSRSRVIKPAVRYVQQC
jgi:hypothetical protein